MKRLIEYDMEYLLVQIGYGDTRKIAIAGCVSYALVGIAGVALMLVSFFSTGTP